MAIKIQTSSIAGPTTIYPNWDFWFEKNTIWQHWCFLGTEAAQTLQLISPNSSLSFSEKIWDKQGDQIGRIIALRAIVFYG
jgi:hypothetical protein